MRALLALVLVLGFALGTASTASACPGHAAPKVVKLPKKKAKDDKQTAEKKGESDKKKSEPGKKKEEKPNPAPKKS